MTGPINSTVRSVISISKLSSNSIGFSTLSTTELQETNGGGWKITVVLYVLEVCVKYFTGKSTLDHGVSAVETLVEHASNSAWDEEFEKANGTYTVY